MVVYDLLTGNHLLGRERTDLHKQMMLELFTIFSNADENKADDLSEREIDILKGAADMFDGGLEDMCEQLMVNVEPLKKYFS